MSFTDTSARVRAGTPRPAKFHRAISVLSVAAVLGSVATAMVSSADSSAATTTATRINSGATAATTSSSGVAWASDRYASGGSTYTAKSSTTVSGTTDPWLYRSSRQGTFTYAIPVSSAGQYTVKLHFAELQLGGANKRVFDVSAEGTQVIQALDIYKTVGRGKALTREFTQSVSDGAVTIKVTSRIGKGLIAGVEVTPSTVTSPAPAPSPTPTETATPAPAPEPEPTATVPVDGEFPTPDTTGPRVALSQLTPTGAVTSSYAGQIIERKDITGNLKIVHDNVTVRDSRISFTSTHGLTVLKKADGTCPVGTKFEYVDVDGRLASEADIPVYSPGCGWTLDHAYVHNVGRTSRMTNNNTVSNSYVFSNRTGDSGAHRGAVGTNGGRNNKIINNVLMCEGTGCSAAIPMYGDFAPVDGMLVQHNLIATTGSYCTYGGSLDSKKYPDGSNIKFIDNHYSTKYFPNCGRYGFLSGFENGVRGNEFTGNVWHETGKPITG